jgi:hypothetical protein
MSREAGRKPGRGARIWQRKMMEAESVAILGLRG